MNDPKARLEHFISGFMGYGSLEAPIWFIGPEEAGAKSPEDLFARIEAWEKLGRTPVVDIYEYAVEIGNTHLFEPGAAPQRTWRRLIEITLLLNGRAPTGEAIREYQCSELGRRRGGVLLTELMPLPKPTVGSWPYAELADELPNLSDLKSYDRAVRPLRVQMLRDAIQHHRPEKVFFYGTSGGVAATWQEIAGVPLVETEGDYRTGRNGPTTFVALKHPNARGKTRRYYLDVARVAKRMECQ